jgi:hypothetical protein
MPMPKASVATMTLHAPVRKALCAADLSPMLIPPWYDITRIGLLATVAVVAEVAEAEDEVEQVASGTERM